MLCRNIKKLAFLFIKHGPRQSPYSDILQLLLPEIIVEYFELTTYEKWKKYFLFTKRRLIRFPTEYRQSKLSYTGFFEPITVQDFPIRANQIYLDIIRGRWLTEDTGQFMFALDSY
jgi:hypothetical protein